MNKQLLKVGVVSAALLPVAGFAAIDDQGMQYVTAAEGLHGSMRVDILHSTDDDGDPNAGLKGGDGDSLRLWVNGSSDLGGGMSSTYYWEVRDGGGDAADGTLGTQAWDLGVSGPFGDIEFGRMAMVAYRLVPSASLAFTRGSNRDSFGCDPCNNGLRYESPSFNGFKFGVSGIMADTAGDDDSVDEFSFGAKYESPIGITVGAGYELAKVPENVTALVGGTDISDDRSGFRFGARYGQDNWLVAYEYRTYEGFWDYNKTGTFVIDPNGSSTVAAAAATAVTGIDVDGTTTTSGIQWNPNVEYEVHAAGVKVTIDRITASANYSVETQSGSATIASTVQKFTEHGRDTFAVDAAYSLGSRSTMVVGWRSVETDSPRALAAGEVVADTPHNGLTAGQVALNGPKSSNKESEVYLYYRVDF